MSDTTMPNTSSTTNTIRWDKDADGVVVLTLDDPNQSANTMNGDYVASMRGVVDRLVAEKEQITGVVITSAKKTFFAGGDLNDLYAARPEQTQQLFDTVTEIKAQLRTPGDPRQAGRRRDQRRRARWWPGDRAREPPPGHRRRARRAGRAARGDPRAAARRRRRGAHRADARHGGCGDEGARAGPEVPARRGQGARSGGRGRRERRRAAADRQGVDRRQPGRGPAVGRQGLQDPGRHAVQPGVRGEPARVPGQPAQAAQGRPLSGAARRSWPPPSRAPRWMSTLRWTIESRYLI